MSGVVAGGMADAAGLRAGDVIERVGGGRVESAAALAAALRATGAVEQVEIEYTRGGARAARSVAVQRVPAPASEGVTVSLEQLEVPGARLRRLVTAPAALAPRAAVLWLQGIACETTEGGLLEELVHDWARAGVVGVRVDKRGVGDSEGGGCGELDLDTEVADARAALAWFVDDERTRGLPRFVFGHSVGGMIAALLLDECAGARVDGVMVYGTSTMRWLDCVVASTRRQLELRGAATAEIERWALGLRERVLAGGLSGRSGAYHRQLDALDLEAAWARARSRVSRLLVLRGEHDWVVGAEEQARLAEIVGARADGEGRAIVVDLPGLDHLLGWHASREDSLRDYGAGRADAALAAATLAWIFTAGVESGV